MNKVELLAPAGSFKGLIASINAGADAVYLGGQSFGARAYAENFKDEELLEAIKVAHLFGKKIYLTVNTLIKENELENLIPYLSGPVKNGLDGVIVQDIGAIYRINKEYPELPIHLSTQLSIVSSDAISLLRRYNVTRVVPARELNIDEIKNIKSKTGIEIEAFIHGAMCYSYSGMCLFSSILGGRSGNRGRCAQPCRLPYALSGTNNASYILSMKDMCTLDIIPELILANIDSFKIEGRMKKPEYAAGVTSIYRKYIDKFYDGTFDKISDTDRRFLSNLYLRSQISEGYYHKHNGKDMITISSPSYNGAEDSVLLDIENRYVLKKPVIGIDCVASFNVRQPFTIEYKYNDIVCSVSGGIVDEAVNAPIETQKLVEQLSKLGDTYFEIKNIKVNNSGNGFLPIKQINELRRKCINELTDRIINVI